MKAHLIFNWKFQIRNECSGMCSYQGSAENMKMYKRICKNSLLNYFYAFNLAYETIVVNWFCMFQSLLASISNIMATSDRRKNTIEIQNKQKMLWNKWSSTTHIHLDPSTASPNVNGLANLMATGKLIELGTRNTWINSI